jgi:5-methylcytosine-specific restriction endonuclease McrA
MCLKQNVVAGAMAVDHITAHKGDQRLFWDQNNWQPLCGPHHNATKQSEERKGFSNEVGLDGWPIDTRHPFNKK